MAEKLGKNAFPSDHTTNDFDCFGPVATRDTVFAGCKMADLGCFQQEGVDSNKFYHIAVVRSKKNGKWFTYFEWGRTKDGKPEKPSFQFHECSTEQEACKIAESQFHEKNTRRGTWEKIGSKERYVSLPKKDCYIVRVLARRLWGLAGAENITNHDAKGDIPVAVAPKVETKKKTVRKIDPQTNKLFRDLLGGAVKYTNAVMSGGKGNCTLPTQQAIDEARDVLDDAMARIKVVGDSVNDQVLDVELRKLTYHLYGAVPKAKPPGQPETAWILSQDNIAAWRLDLDAFETALQAESIHIEQDDSDVMQGIPAEVNWIPPNDSRYKQVAEWWSNASRRRHSHVGSLKIHNLWSVERHGDRKILRDAQGKISAEMGKWNKERPLHQLWNDRVDLNATERKMFWETNTALLFHGTRSVNVPGIVRENLRFPHQLTGVIISGAMFGPGSYFADDYAKSCGYCSHPNPGRRAYYGGGGEVAGRHAFMFAFDVVLGHPHVAPGAHGFTSPPQPHHCVFGKAGHTSSWSGTLMNNEWIIYKRDRIEMRYLAEISW